MSEAKSKSARSMTSRIGRVFRRKRDKEVSVGQIKNFLEGKILSILLRPKERYLEVRADGNFVFGVNADISLDASADVTLTCSRCATTTLLHEAVKEKLSALGAIVGDLPEEISGATDEITTAVEEAKAVGSEARESLRLLGTQSKTLESAAVRLEKIVTKVSEGTKRSSGLRERLGVLRESVYSYLEHIARS